MFDFGVITVDVDRYVDEYSPLFMIEIKIKPITFLDVIGLVCYISRGLAGGYSMVLLDVFLEGGIYHS